MTENKAAYWERTYRSEGLSTLILKVTFLSNCIQCLIITHHGKEREKEQTHV